MRQALKNVPTETTKQLLEPFQKDLKDKTLSDSVADNVWKKLWGGV